MKVEGNAEDGGSKKRILGLGLDARVGILGSWLRIDREGRGVKRSDKNMAACFQLGGGHSNQLKQEPCRSQCCHCIFSGFFN